MDKTLLTIQDQQYTTWVKELKQRYLSLRLKASVAVNQSLLAFYWSIGKDIAEKQYANTYGSAFYKRLSLDMKRELPDEKGFSETNLRNMYYFYSLYNERITNHQQPVDNFGLKELLSIPWGHQCQIIAKSKGDVDQAIFYVKKVIQHSWGRDMLLQFLKSDLYNREGKAITNFKNTLPELQSDLAQQITKDPYNFDFLTIDEGYKEKELEEGLKLLNDCEK